MKSRSFLGLIAALPMFGQIVVINATDAVSASRPVINSNFAYLDAKHLTGTGAPVSTCDVTTVGKLYVRTNAGAANASVYACAKTGGSSYSWEGPFAAVLGIVFNNQANTYSGGGLQDFSSAKVKLPLTVVGSLPTASSNTNVLYLTTNSLSASDCTAGGGSTQALCASNGTTWVGVGGGAPATYQLTDLAITPTSSTVQTIGAGCASSTPCNTQFGQWVNSCAATLVSGDGTAYWYIDSAPSLKIARPASGMSVTVTGSGCSVVTGTSCPADAQCLAATTATSGAWNTLTKAMDKRVFLQGPGPQVTPGTGCVSFGVSGTTTTINCPGTGGGGTYKANYYSISGAAPDTSGGCGPVGSNWAVKTNGAVAAVGGFNEDLCALTMLSTGSTAYYFYYWDGSTVLSAIVDWVVESGTPAAVEWKGSVACPTILNSSTFSTPTAVTTTATTLHQHNYTTILLPMGSCASAGLIKVRLTNTASGSGGTVFTGTPFLLGIIL